MRLEANFLLGNAAPAHGSNPATMTAPTILLTAANPRESAQWHYRARTSAWRA